MIPRSVECLIRRFKATRSTLCSCKVRIALKDPVWYVYRVGSFCSRACLEKAWNTREDSLRIDVAIIAVKVAHAKALAYVAGDKEVTADLREAILGLKRVKRTLRSTAKDASARIAKEKESQEPPVQEATA